MKVKTVKVSVDWRDGQRIQCASCHAGLRCETKLLPGPHTGRVVKVRKDAYLEVKFDDRAFTEFMRKTDVIPIQEEE